jgi:hypothetical protein
MGNLYRFNAVLILFLCVLVVLGGLNSFDFKGAARRGKAKAKDIFYHRGQRGFANRVPRTEEKQRS